MLRLVFFCSRPDSSVTEQGVEVGVQLHVAIVSGRMRRMSWVVAVRLLCVGDALQHEGVSGAGAEAKRVQAPQVGRCPGEADLGSWRWSHHAAVELAPRQPRRDVQGARGVQVRHEG